MNYFLLFFRFNFENKSKISMDPTYIKMLDDFEKKISQSNKLHTDLNKMQLYLNYLHNDISNTAKSISEYFKENNFFKAKHDLNHEKTNFKSIFSKSEIHENNLLKERRIGDVNVIHDENSLLEDMVNGEVNVTFDEKNCIFIDRSPKYFNYVLDILRIVNKINELNFPKNKVITLKNTIKKFYNDIACIQKVSNYVLDESDDKVPIVDTNETDLLINRRKDSSYHFISSEDNLKKTGNFVLDWNELKKTR